MMLWWFARKLLENVAAPEPDHAFERVISLREDDGRLEAFRCTKCGYCSYLIDPDEMPPPCVPRKHVWVPSRVFQWRDLPIADKLDEPLQCKLCGANATTHADKETYGCPGRREEDP